MVHHKKICGPLVKRLRLRPLTPATGVRVPYGSPKTRIKKLLKAYALTYISLIYIDGVNYDEVPPVPIPNTEVKLISAENTWLEAAWKDRSMPSLIYSSLAQSVEHAAVNRRVVGSSPTRGASLSC